MYGVETWSLYEDGRRRVNGAGLDELKRSARISKLDRKTNEYTGLFISASGNSELDCTTTKTDGRKEHINR